MSEKAEPVGCAVELFIKDNVENYSTKTATASQKFSYGGEVIAEIAITGSFRYDGNAVMVTSKGVSKSVTYDGWTFHKSSFISSGGSIA